MTVGFSCVFGACIDRCNAFTCEIALTFEIALCTALTALGTGVGVDGPESEFDFTPLDPLPGAVVANPAGLGERSPVLTDAVVNLADSEFDVPYVFMLSGTEGLALGTVRACGLVGVKNFERVSFGSAQMRRQQWLGRDHTCSNAYPSTRFYLAIMLRCYVSYHGVFPYRAIDGHQRYDSRWPDVRAVRAET
jgi:hypothetical protein